MSHMPSWLRRLWSTWKTTIAQRNIAERDALNSTEFYDRYYLGSGIAPDLVEEILQLVASELRVDVRQLRPADRFAIELTPGRWNEWDSGFAMLMTHLDVIARDRRRTIDTPVVTVDDYIRAMAMVYPDRHVE
ncbi:hypothetical protein [Stenotrophomonas oahuensis]|uniref:Uncharacterized protein n=1 Tax=Stenotrophomonas oahuensis TaxID=3003271 RepID=A0ABY9YSZ9_9GAMM|nr:hypothetical protein [Stenotrophomonas sp. A5586]WNH54070.1 hypothetical protein PDM29_07270 [Stenotrophomonas sp. A5586]